MSIMEQVNYGDLFSLGSNYISKCDEQIYLIAQVVDMLREQKEYTVYDTECTQNFFEQYRSCDKKCSSSVLQNLRNVLSKTINISSSSFIINEITADGDYGLVIRW